MPVHIALPPLVAKHPALASRPALAAALQDGTLPFPMTGDVGEELNEVSMEIAAEESSTRQLRMQAVVAITMTIWSAGEWL